MSKRSLDGMISCKDETSSWHSNGFPGGSRAIFRLYLTYGRYLGLNVLGCYQSHLMNHGHPACGQQGSSSYLSLFLAYDFLSQCKFRTITRDLVNRVRFIFTYYSRRHAFRYYYYGIQDENPDLVKIRTYDDSCRESFYATEFSL